MKRREFIALLGGAAAAWPFAARAQQPTGQPLVGLLSPLSATAWVHIVGPFAAECAILVVNLKTAKSMGAQKLRWTKVITGRGRRRRTLTDAAWSTPQAP